MPITIRALQPQDTDAVVGLYAACLATEPDIGPIKAEMWDGSMRLAQFGFGRDVLVAIDGTELVASRNHRYATRARDSAGSSRSWFIRPVADGAWARGCFESCSTRVRPANRC